ncbi:hypothetical protein BDV93DRAFT_507452 [Ceratobasidium sp. AG-I]|nr:hypothetical protein BDV93DRAFT_507452 [Ceratobasidium sp. AG-I]
MEESSSADPIKELKAQLDSAYTQFLSEPEFDPVAASDHISQLAHAYVAGHEGKPVDIAAARQNSTPKRDTPGAETFSWSAWEALLKAMGSWDSEQHLAENLDRAIVLTKVLQSRPEDEFKCTVWGEDTNLRSLPLVGPCLREANNGPFRHTGPNDEDLVRPEVQNALAGAPVSGSEDESVNLALTRRKEWLALQGYMARLWSEAGVDIFAQSSVWAARDALEDWPTEPPTIISGPLTGEPPRAEETPAYRALMVEGIALWLHYAAPQIYACTEIWGPNGNPDWKRSQGAPGRGGTRWDGVDGMDKEKKRWGLWKSVLKEIAGWYDKEVSAGRGEGWKVKRAVAGALEAMEAVERN